MRREYTTFFERLHCMATHAHVPLQGMLGATPVLDAHVRYFHVQVEAPSSLRMRAACSTCGSKFVAFMATVPLPHFFRHL
jgi:hypothetical protein